MFIPGRARLAYWLGQFRANESDLHDYRRKLAGAVQSALEDAPEDLAFEELRRRGMALLDKVETEADALAPAVFTDELLDAHAKVYLGAFLSSWQLHWPPSADHEGIERFLISRFRLRDVDVPHPDIFGWADPNRA